MTTIRRLIREITQTRPVVNGPVTVRRITRVGASYTRVAIGGDVLGEYVLAQPADAFKLVLPSPDHAATPVMRTFTVSSADPAGAELCFDVLRHQGGVAGEWVRRAEIGDAASVIGMRCDWARDPAASRHVVVADASALPAAAAIIGALPAGCRGVAVLSVAGDLDRELLPVHPALDVHWVHDGRLAEAVRRVPIDPVAQAWVAAEQAVARSVRRHLLETAGIARDHLHASAYWKAGWSGTDSDAAQIERVRRAMRVGADVTDPQTLEDLELG